MAVKPVNDVYWTMESLNEPLIVVPQSLFMRAMEVMVRAEETDNGSMVMHARRYLESGGRILPPEVVGAMHLKQQKLQRFEIDIVPTTVSFKEKPDA